MMLRTLIIDDENKCSEILRIKLERHCPEIQVLEVVNSPLMAEERIRLLKPDLLFIDIEMPHLNGFDILKLTEDVPYEVVFTTAYDHYAVQAFRHNALDYLMKPVDSDDLQAVVKKAITRKNNGTGLRNDIEKLLAGIEQANKLNKITIPSLEGMTFVDISEIVQIKADRNYSLIHLRNGKKITSTRKLKDYEEAIGNSQFSRQFFRVHNSHFVNLHCVTSYIRGDGGTLVLNDGSHADVSRNKKQEVLELLQ
ncbi:MAG TPA: LytTR family DNA-binding domain-containing protein [Bacteroidia bacterium]|jgi:two-component system LytT family response regulator|nr:LytTR family DNA-binding domain-containing protein [Bacteroidia bacterium]